MDGAESTRQQQNPSTLAGVSLGLSYCGFDARIAYENRRLKPLRNIHWLTSQ